MQLFALKRISVNVVHNHRDSRAYKERGMELDSADGVPELSKDDDLEGAMVHRQAIDRALATLPTDMRLLVILRACMG
jgi:DNA-directed RNA polymerase specialized sigma24 family protein